MNSVVKEMHTWTNWMIRCEMLSLSLKKMHSICIEIWSNISCIQKAMNYKMIFAFTFGSLTKVMKFKCDTHSLSCDSSVRSNRPNGSSQSHGKRWWIHVISCFDEHRKMRWWDWVLSCGHLTGAGANWPRSMLIKSALKSLEMHKISRHI